MTAGQFEGLDDGPSENIPHDDDETAEDRARAVAHAARDLRKERLTLALRGGTAGPERRRAMTAMVEKALQLDWAAAVAPLNDRPRRRRQSGLDGLALAAVGSVARGQTGPASDLDLVLLHDGRRLPADEVGELAQRLWYPLWDGGLRLDHSVRTPNQCREVASADLSAAIGLLDLRVIAGDAALVVKTRTSLLSDWRGGIRRRLPQLLESLDERAERYGEAAHLLEPDLKEARGGLRDVTVLRALAASWVTDRPHGSVDEVHELLLDVRDSLQAVTGKNNDRLLLPEQDSVAVLCGLTDADELLARVADCTRSIAYAVDVTARRARQSLPTRRLRPGPRRPRLRPLGHGLVEHDGEVVLGVGVEAAQDPVLPIRAAATAVRAGLPLSPVTVEHLAQDCPPLPDPWPTAAREEFVGMLAGGPSLAQVWESLDRAGVIARWIPEWTAVRNRPQRNAIHRHTVDRHLIETVMQIQGALRDTSRPDLLVLAALLHDIGKIAGAQDHSIAGAPIAGKVARRMGLSEQDSELIERLVREHLTLIELATRRDPDDPRTVEALVGAVGERQETLHLLRALTEADATAVGSVAWTAWRARLVDDLMARAATALSGEEPPGPAPIAQAEVELVRTVLADGRPRVAVTPMDELFTVTVVAPDRSGLLADIAGVLASFRLTVKSALVRTVGSDHLGEAVEGDHDIDIAVDTWWVESRGDMPPPELLEQHLRRLSEGDQSVLDPLIRRDAGFRSRAGAPARPRVVLLPGASEDATVLEVRAADRPGLMHAIGSALAGVGVDLRSAHVATHAGQAVDVLYVCERGGGPLAPPRVAETVSVLVDAGSVPSA
ncbi:[protein-PII] uridylyltransferase [Kineosporia sp. NBRC 101731]|uniref:[protein-PII] uridylyltransferase n=1 Tax=Kineosporia sp. NBRC 101731 TaxID=3032199 RepID=UPI0024A32081|nr:[protein-PII] uridylyltransferase [Kineosporia sp. NBRC 101731]GLY30154.1 bifunctional uridylyltransferase/uridylyl-removing enzyme [Kineosporia sp. NBRC 101731]